MPMHQFIAGNQPRAVLSLTAPVTDQITQRSGSSAAVVIRGSVSTAFTKIQAKAAHLFVGGSDVDWTDVITTPGVGAFSGTFTLPGGDYRVSVRAVYGGSVLHEVAVSSVGVGEIFVIAGQSNAANYGAGATTVSDRRVRSYNIVTRSWQVGNDPQPNADGAGGTPWPTMANTLLAALSVPIGLVDVAIGGTSVADWVVAGALDITLRTAVAAFPANGFRAFLWHQGESDGFSGTLAATYEAALEAIIDDSRSVAGWAIPWGIATATYRANVTSATIQGAQAVVAAYTGCFAGADSDSLTTGGGYRSDGSHMSATGLVAHGNLWAAALTTKFGW